MPNNSVTPPPTGLGRAREETDYVLERFDQTEPALQREIVAELARQLHEARTDERWHDERMRKAILATCKGALAAALGEPLHTVAQSGYEARTLEGDSWENAWQFVAESLALRTSQHAGRVAVGGGEQERIEASLRAVIDFAYDHGYHEHGVDLVAEYRRVHVTPTDAQIERAARALVDEGEFTVGVWEDLTPRVRTAFLALARRALAAALEVRGA